MRIVLPHRTLAMTLLMAVLPACNQGDGRGAGEGEDLGIQVRVETVDEVWDHILLEAPVTVMRRPSGGLVLADRQRVQLLDEHGSSVTQLGRTGEGPGEYERVGGITTDSAGGVYVYDPRLDRLTYFHPDGEVGGTRNPRIPFELGLPSFESHSFLVRGDTMVAEWKTGIVRTTEPDRHGLVKEVLGEASGSVLAEWEGISWVELPDGVSLPKSPADEAPAIDFSARHGVVALAEDRTACVLVADPRGVWNPREVCLPWTRIPMRQPVVSLEEAAAAGVRPAVARMLTDKDEVQDFTGPMDGVQVLSFDEMGCLWARMTNDEASYDVLVMMYLPERRPSHFEWLVVDPSRETVVAQVWLPYAFDPQTRAGSDLFGFLRQEDHTQWIARVEIPPLKGVECL